jgi:hypothetical protein
MKKRTYRIEKDRSRLCGRRRVCISDINVHGR